MLSQVRSSSRVAPRDTNNFYSFEMDGAHGQQSEEDASRTVHRTFAFDEWDEEETMPNDAIETNVGYTSKSSGDFREEIQDAAAVASNVCALDDDLHRIIRRTFAFDEWDDDDFIMGLLVGHKDNKTRDKCAASNMSFMPINNEDDSSVTMGNNDTSTTKDDDAAADITNLWKSSSFLSNTNTKFDLDNQQHHTSTTITPSPASKSNNKRNRIQRPFPLYSQQTVEPAALFSDPARTPPVSWHESFTSSSSDTNRRPEDYKSLEHIFQRHLRPDGSEPSPPQCESIPRRTSAFRSVGPTAMANNALITPVPSANNNNQFSSFERNESHDSTRVDRRNLLDQYLGSGINLFRDDDDIFDSPTSTSEDSPLSSTIPRFIMFQNNEWE
jgi:hypothetical protein